MKKKYYLILDTETATVPFVNDYAKTDKQRQSIAIAKPLVYDIGWIIMNREGEILDKKNYLVQETFFVPNVFNTAYYKEKRPLYMEMYEKGEIISLSWNEIIKILLEDLHKIDFVCAYNAAFDFKKAIPFTEKYIKALYSSWYNKFEERQKKSCERIAFGKNESKNEKYLNPVFELRNEEFPIVDLWGAACKKIINTNKYKEMCLNENWLTATGLNFKTSAETTFRYIKKDSEFIESHTALDDAKIESEILAKILKKGKVEPDISAFPFKELGTTKEYLLSKKKVEEKQILTVIKMIQSYLKDKNENRYTRQLENIIASLENLLDENSIL